MPSLCLAWLCLLWVAACAQTPSQSMPSQSMPSQSMPSQDMHTQAVGAQVAEEDDGGVYTVVLPRPLRAGELLMLEVELGTTGAGLQVVLRTLDGQLVGTVSPHGIRHGAAAGTYLVPVPAPLLQHIAGKTRWPLLVRIESSAAPPRTVDTETVRAIRAVITPD